MTLFNSKGELNAGSHSEAIQLITKLASILQDGQSANYGFAGQPSISDEKRDELVSRALNTQEGKVALAQAMANPIN
jgi:hypothetical protein